MTTRDLAFLSFAALAAISGLFAVRSNRVVHAALWLVTALGAVAGCYLALGAELVALVQVLVYVGAVVVLVLFALMLTAAPIERHPEASGTAAYQVVAALTAGAIAVLLAVILLPLAPDEPVAVASDTEGIARAIFAIWAWPFELLSVLLLAALIGALAATRISRGRSERTR